MKRYLGLKIFLLFLSILTISFTSETKTISEMLGYLIKAEIDKCHYDIDIDSVIEGLRQAKEGHLPPLSQEQYDSLVSKIVQQAIANKEKENIRLANDFFLNNKNAIEVVEKKVQYQVLAEGAGDGVNLLNTPLIRIKGSLLNEKIFLPEQEYVISFSDLSEPLKLAILGMKEKERRKIFIHPDYHQAFFDVLAPRGALLIYEVELIKKDKVKINLIQNSLADNGPAIR